MSKVYISYLATRLNKVNDYNSGLSTKKLNVLEDGLVQWKDFSVAKRTSLLHILKDLPVRDEVICFVHLLTL